MPRDDLTIDFIGRKGMMPKDELPDCATVLDDWSNRVANLPHEIAFMQDEIKEKDRLMDECLKTITQHDEGIQKWIRLNGSHTSNPKEEASSRIILSNYDKCSILQEEKIALAKKTQLIIDKHMRQLDIQIKALQDRGEFPTDADIPSLLRPQPPERSTASRVDATAAMPLGPINNSATVIHRHPNQYPPRMIPPHVQTQQGSVSSSSAPATPSAAMLNRQARESSLGANAKRQRVTGGLVVHPPSGLARQSSMTPGTPRGGTPTTAARAGSAGPRTAQKSLTKKVAPHGSRQSMVARQQLKKSGLSRVKRTGNKNSPSSTNDSELSDAESGSVEDEDEHRSPRAAKDGDGDEEMGDDDDGADNKAYCLCQKVSYGDMVACDNDKCPFEWFHWTCVGLKSEPVGNWICPVCSAKAGRK